MKNLLTIPIVTLLFVLVRSADLAITNALARSIVRAVAYGLVALIALIVVLVALIGV